MARGRQYLHDEVQLYGESDGQRFPRTFRITRVIGEGAQAISYEAYYDGSGMGVLKEFYPDSAYGVRRDESGHLAPEPDFPQGWHEYEEARDEYLRAYQQLLELKLDRENSELATYLPPIELYYGCDSSGNESDSGNGSAYNSGSDSDSQHQSDRIKSVYVWNPEPGRVSFQKICDEIHANPTEKPEHKLVMALNAIRTLTECVNSLHDAGLVHRDIKPANFGFLLRSEEALTQSISLFDIDSICDIFSTGNEIVGTPGFMEPERKSAVRKTDIFAVGATLFYAIVHTEETQRGRYLYKNEYFDRIPELIETSALIQASEANRHPRLRSILSDILQKCLCRRAARYEECGELLADLEEALYYALPTQMARNGKKDKWILQNADEFLDVHKEKNTSLTLQYHLYRHPIYECSPSGCESLRVLVAGCGNCGQKFLDACLQAGQNIASHLDLLVLSDHEKDREIYLSARPALGTFFDIDHSMKEEEKADSYGSVSFAFDHFRSGKKKYNERLIRKLVHNHFGEGNLHYVFVALGSDELNREVAALFEELGCSVNYVVEKETDFDAQERDEQYGCCSAICVDAPIRQDLLYPEIERMALNTHLLWERDRDVEFEKIRDNFEQPYNHDASVASVLSIKYKLHSMGIELEQCSFEEAAKLYVERVERGLALASTKLMWFEHRRWVTEKLCKGWTKITDLRECLYGPTRDEAGKRHICLVQSRPDRKLEQDYTAQSGVHSWDAMTDAQISELDDLDRLSVELHKMYRQKATELRKQGFRSAAEISEIQSIIRRDPKVTAAFREWCSCIKEIWSGDETKTTLYNGLKDNFIRSLQDFPAEQQNELVQRVQSLQSGFAPILASEQYRDWKNSDVHLIENIPFILTYSTEICMGLELDPDNLIDSLAAITKVNPVRIILTFNMGAQKEHPALTRSLRQLAGYMDRKKLRGTVELRLYYDFAPAPGSRKQLDRKLFAYTNNRLGKIEHIEKMGDIMEEAVMTPPFTTWKNILPHIPTKPTLTIADLNSFEQGTMNMGAKPEFYDCYEDLWAVYLQNPNAWQNMCHTLQSHMGKADPKALFVVEADHQTEIRQTFRWIIPLACRLGALKIVEYLKDASVIGAESDVTGYTSDSCEVQIFAQISSTKSRFARLFSDYQMLLLPDAISFRQWQENDECSVLTMQHRKKEEEGTAEKSSAKYVQILFDSLEVTGLKLPEDNKDKEQMVELLRFLDEKRMIANLHLSGDGADTVNFVFATRAHKKLLTREDRIKEIYLYHALRESNAFDDLAPEVTITSASPMHLALVMTKGFRPYYVGTDWKKMVQFAEQRSAAHAHVAQNESYIVFTETELEEQDQTKLCKMNIAVVHSAEELKNL